MEADYHDNDIQLTAICLAGTLESCNEEGICSADISEKTNKK